MHMRMNLFTKRLVVEMKRFFNITRGEGCIIFNFSFTYSNVFLRGMSTFRFDTKCYFFITIQGYSPAFLL